MCREAAGSYPVEFRQSNSEAELIDWIHEAIDSAAGIVINPAAFTFTSLAILDALKMFAGPSSSCTSPTSTGASRSITTHMFRRSRPR